MEGAFGIVAFGDFCRFLGMIVVYPAKWQIALLYEFQLLATATATATTCAVFLRSKEGKLLNTFGVKQLGSRLKAQGFACSCSANT